MTNFLNFHDFHKTSGDRSPTLDNSIPVCNKPNQTAPKPKYSQVRHAMTSPPRWPWPSHNKQMVERFELNSERVIAGTRRPYRTSRSQPSTGTAMEYSGIVVCGWNYEPLYFDFLSVRVQRLTAEIKFNCCY
jgi:hypothetical protein